LRVVDGSVASDGKTKGLVAALSAMGVAAEPTLLVTATLGKPLARAARNVPWLTVEPPAHVSVYQLLRARHVIVEQAALTALQEGLQE